MTDYNPDWVKSYSGYADDMRHTLNIATALNINGLIGVNERL